MVYAEIHGGMSHAYGASVEAEWDAAVISLLERGMIYAVASPRGGGELGRYWYEDGRLTYKNHTFTDTVAIAEHLISARLPWPLPCPAP